MAIVIEIRTEDEREAPTSLAALCQESARRLLERRLQAEVVGYVDATGRPEVTAEGCRGAAGTVPARRVGVHRNRGAGIVAILCASSRRPRFS